MTLPLLIYIYIYNVLFLWLNNIINFLNFFSNILDFNLTFYFQNFVPYSGEMEPPFVLSILCIFIIFIQDHNTPFL